MLWILKKITERLKALLVANAALDLEAELMARQTERKAELLLKAQGYEEQGLEELAKELRSHALALSVDQPLGALHLTLDAEGESSDEDSLRLNGSTPPQPMLPSKRKPKRP